MKNKLIVLLSVIALGIGATVNAKANNTEIDFLVSLGAIEVSEKPIDENKNITRAEFAVILDKVLNEGKTSIASQGNPYADMDEKSYGYGSVQALTERKLFEGNNTCFYPENNLTCMEAAKVLTAMLGYSMQAEENGGFPQGYLQAAYEADLFDGVSCGVNDTLTVLNAAKLIYNALRADYVIADIQGSKISYELSDEAYMEKTLSITEDVGIVTGTEIVRVYANGNCKDGAVEIDEVQYDLKGNINDFVGHKVLFYYKTHEDDSQEVFFWTDYRTNEVLKLSTKEIEDCDGKEYVYSIGDETRSKKAEIDDGASVVLNGRIAGRDFTDSDFKPENGYVELIDHDNDRKYDVVMIWNYEVFGVDQIIEQNKTIVDQITRKKIILDENDCKYYIKKNGQEATFADIAKYDALLVAKCNDEIGDTIYIIEASDHFVTGKITSYSDDEIAIDGVEYELSPGFTQSIEMGTLYDYYIDSYGYIAYYNENSGENVKKYGILFNKWQDEASETDCYVKIYTDKKEIVTFKFAKKVKFDGEMITSDKAVAHANMTNSSGGKRQLIGYALNNNGEINLIDTATIGENETSEDSLVDLGYYSSACYLGGGPVFSDFFLVSGSAKTFRVPRGQTEGVISEEAEFDYRFDVSGLGYFKDTYSYPVRAFTIDKGLTADIFLYYVSTESAGIFNGPLMVVESVGQIIDENDDVIPCIRGRINNNEEVSVPCFERAAEEVSLLSKGDIIQYDTIDGKLDVYRILYDFDGTNSYHITRPLVTAPNRVVYGEITEVDGNNMKLSYTNNEDGSLNVSEAKPYNMSKAKYMRLNENGMVEEAYVSDIEVGKKCILKMNGGNVQYVVFVAE